MWSIRANIFGERDKKEIFYLMPQVSQEHVVPVAHHVKKEMKIGGSHFGGRKGKSTPQ